MELPTPAEDELDYSCQPEEDEEYPFLSCNESTKQDEDEEEYICFPTQKEEEQEMDEEQQVLCEGSLWSP